MSARPDGWKHTSGQRASRPYWQARFAGDCEACPEPIEVGQEIMRADAGGYVHVICPVPRPATKFTGTSDSEMGF